MKGRTAFLDYYTSTLPAFKHAERLERYLTTHNPPVLLMSPFHWEELQQLWQKQGLGWWPLRWFQSALEWPKEMPVGTTLPGFAEGWLYALNPSSLLPVLALEPKAGETILDACAAPGGKTLGMATLINPERTTIVANDVSRPRFKRLRTALKHFGYPALETRCLPLRALANQFPAGFDAILLDAPCSSEKHVFNAKKYLKAWSLKRVQTLAKRQVHLVEETIPLLKPGGRLIYSTCALTPEENEAVIAQTLEGHPELMLDSLPSTLPLRPAGLLDHGLTPTQAHQVIRLNDLTGGWDPMFVAKFRKT